MAASVPIEDKQWLNTTTNGSGDAVFTIPCVTADQIYELTAKVFIGAASGGHLAGGAKLRSEYVLENKNSTLTAIAAISGSTNPLNSNTTGEAAAFVQALDASEFGATTAIWTVSSPNAILTVHVTTSGGGAFSGVTVYVKLEINQWGIT